MKKVTIKNIVMIIELILFLTSIAFGCVISIVTILRFILGSLQYNEMEVCAIAQIPILVWAICSLKHAIKDTFNKM